MENSSAELHGNTLILDFNTYRSTIILMKAIDDETDILSMPEGSGTGFAIHADGYVATNHHVIKGHEVLYLLSTDNRFPSPIKAEVVASDSIHDIAILKINDSQIDGFGQLPYNITSKSLKRGEEVFCLGYPRSPILGEEIKASQGIITALNGTSPSQYMVSLDIDHGSSGSPVFDKKGNIVGIITSLLTWHDMMLTANQAVKSFYLVQLMQQVGIAPIPPQQQEELSSTELIDTIAPYVFLIECY